MKNNTTFKCTQWLPYTYNDIMHNIMPQVITGSFKQYIINAAQFHCLKTRLSLTRHLKSNTNHFFKLILTDPDLHYTFLYLMSNRLNCWLSRWLVFLIQNTDEAINYKTILPNFVILTELYSVLKQILCIKIILTHLAQWNTHFRVIHAFVGEILTHLVLFVLLLHIFLVCLLTVFWQCLF